ncbi:MAG: aminopeptidase P family protein [Anaerolineaceae bacterium]|nr:aminopeptidase P family protein [Anaerolineaceae bacterium]
MTERISNLQNTLASADADAYAINPGSMLTYLTGLTFHLNERPVVLLITPDSDPSLILPEFELEQLTRVPQTFRTFTYQDNPHTWGKAFQGAAQAAGLQGKKIGIDPIQFRFMEMNFLQEAAQVEFIVAGELFANLRMCKDEQEADHMLKAAQIAEAALEETIKIIKANITEKDIANELTYQLLKNGSETDLPFQPYVGSGPNGANPHGSVTDRKILPGDFIVIDYGARWQGYCSDITRTFAVGKVAPERAHIYEIVKEANRAGREAAKPGIRAGDVDDATRQLIVQAGYAQYFTHRTGHGLGLDVHEDPYMFAENDLILKPGMTFTVEPGIYISADFGVRIEDDVIITADAAKSLTTFPRDLIQL